MKRYDAELRSHHRGRANPGPIVSHDLPPEEAPSAYANCDERASGWTKVLLEPGRKP